MGRLGVKASRRYNPDEELSFPLAMVIPTTFLFKALRVEDCSRRAASSGRVGDICDRKE